MPDSEDRRSRRSRRALWQALMILMEDHDWATISVLMICNKADVARSTFYAHYQTKQDLLDEGFAEVEAQLATLPEAGGMAATLSWLVTHLRDASAFHRRLQGSSAGHVIIARFRRLMQERIKRDLTGEGWTGQESDLDFCMGGVFAVLEAWLSTGCREDPMVIGSKLLNLVRRVADAGTPRP